MDFKDVPAIITGGGSGLGAATAKLFSEAGAKVAILDINKSKAEKFAESIGASVYKCDVSDEASAKEAVAAAEGELGPIGITISCAGIGWVSKVYGKNGPHPLNMFEKVINVNLIGTFNIMRYAAESMAKRDPNEGGERGVIVNTSSVAAFDGQMGQIAYSASKGGVVAMTLPAARDLARMGIRVCTICPGIFDTPMMAMTTEKVREALAAQVPFPARLGHPEDYASLAGQIVQNPYLNGETIRLDGAIRMQPK